MRISDWSSDVCSSDLRWRGQRSGIQACTSLGQYELRPGKEPDHCVRQCVSWPYAVHGLCRWTAEVLARFRPAAGRHRTSDRKSVVSGKSGSVRVDLGGCRNIKKNKTTKKKQEY